LVNIMFHGLINPCIHLSLLDLGEYHVPWVDQSLYSPQPSRPWSISCSMGCEVNTRIDQPMEHDIYQGLEG
jgi:hypothetical protein